MTENLDRGRPADEKGQWSSDEEDRAFDDLGSGRLLVAKPQIEDPLRQKTDVPVLISASTIIGNDFLKLF